MSGGANSNPFGFFVTTRTRSQHLKIGAPHHPHNNMATLINSKDLRVVEPTTDEKAKQTRTLCHGCAGSFNEPPGTRQHQANNYSAAGTGAVHSPHNDGYLAILLIIFLIIMVVLGHYMKFWYVIITDIPPSPNFTNNAVVCRLVRRNGATSSSRSPSSSSPSGKRDMKGEDRLALILKVLCDQVSSNQL
jgi:hypothetical protein